MVLDRRSLELPDKEVGMSLFHAGLQTWKMDLFGLSLGFYDPLMEGLSYGKECGALRGLWENLWCIGGEFNVICLPPEQMNAYICYAIPNTQIYAMIHNF